MRLKDVVIKEFHNLYYGEAHNSPVLNSTTWMGHKILKAPTDLWSYQEIMYETRPDVVIETGTLYGGSALWFAQMMDLLDLKPGVLSIDITGDTIPARPRHEKIKYLTGSSTSKEVLEIVDSYLKGASGRLGRSPRTMVVLDSDHRAQHVFNELEAYSGLVTPGCYLIVEDSNINGHPVLHGWGRGPMEALEEWLPKHPEFAVDAHRERFLLTMNPRGFLRKMEESRNG